MFGYPESFSVMMTSRKFTEWVVLNVETFRERCAPKCFASKHTASFMLFVIKMYCLHFADEIVE